MSAEETNLAADLTDDQSTSSIYGYLLLILPKFPASLSILGSVMIISSVVRSKQNRENVQQRLVAAMSCFDCMVSSVWLLTNFFIPPGFGSMMPATFGNTTSCNAQGFLVQLSIASVVYNASLSFYYLLVIKYNWRKTRIAQIEKYFHTVPIAFGVLTAIIAVSLQTIGNADWDCWIAPNESNSNEKLVRAFQWAFFFGPLWLCMLFNCVNMFRVYRVVKETEAKAAKWRAGENLFVQTKNVAKQNLLYVLGFMLTWIFPTIARIVQAAHGTVPKWLVVVCGTFIPLQGFVNSLVYFRLRFHKCGAEHSDKGTLWVIGRIILLTLMPCFTKDVHNISDGRDLEDDLHNSKTSKSTASRFSSMDHVSNADDAVSAEVTPQPKTKSKWEKMNAAKSTNPSNNRLSLRGLRHSWKTLRKQGTQTIGKAKSTRTLAAMFDKLSNRNLKVEKEDDEEEKEEHFPIPVNEETGDEEFLPIAKENENEIVPTANDTTSSPKDASKEEIQNLLTSAAQPNTVQINTLSAIESIDSETRIGIQESTENCFLSSIDEEVVSPEADIEQPDSSFHCSHTSPYKGVSELDTSDDRNNDIDIKQGSIALDDNEMVIEKDNDV
ncbi:hypothetical protein CTEN210_06652 [Chaetoceros tenuissimus]|uniref:G-protein coupled receptors family 2 profile 2 domain-containing protein n=1 Tax=Chaetoceros tenuissimus TaxID=426638 RepID=A0AAD3H4N8_9STRA|nr:hypothetical protein CTEN210_06652 [Chaetoceros tenuissimus]